MISDREGIASLALTTSDLLLDLPESGFYFPASAIELDDLLHAQTQVSGDQGAAQVLGLKPTTLESRMKKLGINRMA